MTGGRSGAQLARQVASSARPREPWRAGRVCGVSSVTPSPCNAVARPCVRRDDRRRGVQVDRQLALRRTRRFGPRVFQLDGRQDVQRPARERRSGDSAARDRRPARRAPPGFVPGQILRARDAEPAL